MSFVIKNYGDPISPSQQLLNRPYQPEQQHRQGRGGVGGAEHVTMQMPLFAPLPPFRSSSSKTSMSTGAGAAAAAIGFYSPSYTVRRPIPCGAESGAYGVGGALGDGTVHGPINGCGVRHSVGGFACAAADADDAARHQHHHPSTLRCCFDRRSASASAYPPSSSSSPSSSVSFTSSVLAAFYYPPQDDQSMMPFATEGSNGAGGDGLCDDARRHQKGANAEDGLALGLGVAGVEVGTPTTRESPHEYGLGGGAVVATTTTSFPSSCFGPPPPLPMPFSGKPSTAAVDSFQLMVNRWVDRRGGGGSSSTPTAWSANQSLRSNVPSPLPMGAAAAAPESPSLQTLSLMAVTTTTPRGGQHQPFGDRHQQFLQPQQPFPPSSSFAGGCLSVDPPPPPPASAPLGPGRPNPFIPMAAGPGTPPPVSSFSFKAVAVGGGREMGGGEALHPQQRPLPSWVDPACGGPPHHVHVLGAGGGEGQQVRRGTIPFTATTAVAPLPLSALNNTFMDPGAPLISLVPTGAEGECVDSDDDCAHGAAGPPPPEEGPPVVIASSARLNIPSHYHSRHCSVRDGGRNDNSHHDHSASSLATHSGCTINRGDASNSNSALGASATAAAATTATTTMSSFPRDHHHSCNYNGIGSANASNTNTTTLASSSTLASQQRGGSNPDWSPDHWDGSTAHGRRGPHIGDPSCTLDPAIIRNNGNGNDSRGVGPAGRGVDVGRPPLASPLRSTTTVPVPASSTIAAAPPFTRCLQGTAGERMEPFARPHSSSCLPFYQSHPHHRSRAEGEGGVIATNICASSNGDWGGSATSHFGNSSSGASWGRANSSASASRSGPKRFIEIPTDDELRAFLKQSLGSAYPTPKKREGEGLGAQPKLPPALPQNEKEQQPLQYM